LRSEKKGIVWFDCEGVLTEHPSSWQLLHEHFGVKDTTLFAEFYKRGYISYSDWMKIDIALMIYSHGKPITRADIERVLSNIKVRDGSVEVVNEIKQNFIVGVISSGIDLLVKKICEYLKPDICLYNELLFIDDVLVPGGKDNVPLLEKPRIIRSYSSILGFEMDHVVYVGDSLWDVDVFREVGVSIAVKPCGEACDYADYVVESLKEIPAILKKHFL